MENKRIVVYPGARHVVVIEKPELREKLVEDVLQFLDEHSPQ
jgi:alpha-beta hydrolase superfamily lysophospholipase